MVMLDVFWWIVKIGIALVAAVTIYMIGARSIGNFSKGEPPPDPAEAELEDVDYRYQCIVCGAQAVLYAAPEGEIPDPPRHCREPMALVTAIDCRAVVHRLWITVCRITRVGFSDTRSGT